MSDTEKPPAFQFYPNDFILDNDLKTMSNEAVGMYIKLLCYDWMNDGIPADKRAIMRLADYNHTDLQGETRDSGDFDIIFEQIAGKFIPHPTKDGIATNPRLIRERKKQKKNKIKRKNAGELGAKARWDKDKVNKNLKKIAADKQM